MEGLWKELIAFFAFVQMYKQTITYNHYPVIIYHTDQFYFPCSKYVTGAVFVTNCTMGYAGLLLELVVNIRHGALALSQISKCY